MLLWPRPRTTKLEGKQRTSTLQEPNSKRKTRRPIRPESWLVQSSVLEFAVVAELSDVYATHRRPGDRRLGHGSTLGMRSARIATKYVRPSSLRSCHSHAGMSRSAIRRWPIESSIAWSTTPIGLRCAGTRCGKVAESRTPEPKLTTGPKPVRSRRSCHCSALHELGFKPQTVTKYARPDFVPRHLINDLEPGS